jgi:LacI family transcriptional regulator
VASKRVTIADVAREAGVSVATVSKVLNDRYGVARATAEKVNAAIADLGYESSLIARSLRSRQTNVLGILVADLEPFSTELLKGAALAVQGTGYELVVYSGGGHSQDNAGWERRSLARLSGTLTDGTILVTPTVDLRPDAPLVVVDPHAGSPVVPVVDSDNLSGAVTATEYLIGLGHRRIGFIGGRSDLESARLREQGYRQALTAAGIEVDPDLILEGGYTAEGSERPAHQLLEMDDRPTAVFAANDLSAIETVEVAHALNLVVPDDLSVIGFDNVPESALNDPPLTTIDQSIQQMGFEAVRLLVETVKDPDRPAEHITLPTTLVERRSCRAVDPGELSRPPTGDPPAAKETT